VLASREKQERARTRERFQIECERSEQNAKRVRLQMRPAKQRTSEASEVLAASASEQRSGLATS